MAASCYNKLLISVVFLTILSIINFSYWHSTTATTDLFRECQCPTVTNNGTNNIPNNNTPYTRNNTNNTNNNNDPPTHEKQENKSDELEVIIAIPTIASTLERRMQVRLTYISEYKEVHCPYCPTPHSNPKVFPKTCLRIEMPRF